MRYLLIILSLFLLITVPQQSNAADIFTGKDAGKCEAYFARYEREHTLPTRILKAISTQESGRWNRDARKVTPWPWTINVEGKGFYFPTKSQAVAAVRKYQRQGVKSIDVGCMQVNLMYHPDAFRTLEEAFEPQYNVQYSAELLRSHYDKKASWKQAVAAYHAGVGASTSTNGRQYAKKVLTTWRAEIDDMVSKNKRREALKGGGIPVAMLKDRSNVAYD